MPRYTYFFLWMILNFISSLWMIDWLLQVAGMPRLEAKRFMLRQNIRRFQRLLDQIWRHAPDRGRLNRVYLVMVLCTAPGVVCMMASLSPHTDTLDVFLRWAAVFLPIFVCVLAAVGVCYRWKKKHTHRR
ncbi:Uncharacterised protein [Anaerotruncus sp. 2789STDY5834896]|uniref:Uncharacterized protein n=1 Tax=uncultured Anaerotruncus sp. TaxID=905011 RepID=A0A1C6J461_9FIRM|nr:Uncharacterised protein [uncultured Anaerotruncus sp.]